MHEWRIANWLRPGQMEGVIGWMKEYTNGLNEWLTKREWERRKERDRKNDKIKNEGIKEQLKKERNKERTNE